MQIRANLVTQKRDTISFSIGILLSEIKIPEYQRGIVWTDEQQQSFIASCILEGDPIPYMTLLYKKPLIGMGKSSLGVYPQYCYLVDGLQRYNALKRFITGSLSIVYKGQTIFYNNIPNQEDILRHAISFLYIEGTDEDGIRWIDNEQKRVAHTAGDYLYRHKVDRGICKIVVEVFQQCRDTLLKYLDKDTCHGNYIILRDEDFYPILAAIIASKYSGWNKKEIPSCWPNREGVLWLDREDIKRIKYSLDTVKDVSQKINRISTKYTPQTLHEYILIESQAPVTKVINTCRAIIVSNSSAKKGSICGCTAKYTNTFSNKPCCGNHSRSTAKFE